MVAIVNALPHTLDEISNLSSEFNRITKEIKDDYKDLDL